MELKQTVDTPLLLTATLALALDNKPDWMNVGVSPAIEGNVQIAHEVPLTTAGNGIKLGVVLFVSENTT
jgi:hypothetical protein